MMRLVGTYIKQLDQRRIKCGSECYAPLKQYTQEVGAEYEYGSPPRIWSYQIVELLSYDDSVYRKQSEEYKDLNCIDIPCLW